MCELNTSRSLSRLGTACGALSLAALLAAFVSGAWLYAREPVRLPGGGPAASITFRIGLWRVCPHVSRADGTHNVPSPACSLVKYSKWDDVTHSDLNVWTTLDFTPAFVTRMRLSTPFQAASLVLMLLATMFAIAGHCSGDHKTLVAVGLYIMGGLSLGSGLVIFACVLSDASLERPRRPTAFLGAAPALQPPPGELFDYQYGWSFFAAGAAVILAEAAALLCVTAYLRRFPSVEEMVRAVVPGAERALRHSEGGGGPGGGGTAPGSELLRPARRNRRQHPPPRVFSAAKPRALDAADLEGAEGPLLNNTAPDICSANPKSDLTEEGVVVVSAELGPDHEGSLAGVTVPITLMRPQPAPAPTPTPFLFAQQLGTLVHQGVLGVVSEGTSTSSSSSAGTCPRFSTLQPRRARGGVSVSTFSTRDTFEEVRSAAWSNSEV